MTSFPDSPAATTEALMASVVAAATSASATPAHREAALQYLATMITLGGVAAPGAPGTSVVPASTTAPVSSSTLPASAPAPAPAAAPAPTNIPVGEWTAGVLYGEVPRTHLATNVPDNGEGWYGVIKGRTVGITQSQAEALQAVVGVSNNAMKSHKTLAGALFHFNHALDIGLVERRSY
ncbi:hypothetical protein C8R43DRAFT_950023 [Mycena crocata]|nr:hypothetical protein C8R43DRAFT_950023 [Mycena crocata]